MAIRSILQDDIKSIYGLNYVNGPQSDLGKLSPIHNTLSLDGPGWVMRTGNMAFVPSTSLKGQGINSFWNKPQSYRDKMSPLDATHF